LKAQELMVTTV